jgi:hypothetical protein
MRTQINMGLAQAFPGQQSILQSKFTPTKAGRNGTLIAIILDESGNMASCWDATIQGFNELVQGQAQAENAGAAYLTLVKFDAPRITTLYENMNVKEVPPLTRQSYAPNGGTNLMDAIGSTLNRINQFLDKIPTQERPGVLIQIITDGEENSSNSYNGDQIKTMVKQAETDADWTFQFLGANVDAFHMGSTFGMNATNTATYNTTSMAATMNVILENTRAVRASKMAGVSTQELYASAAFYSDDDRKKMRGE